jgi:KUP system potassium uptake protein
VTLLWFAVIAGLGVAGVVRQPGVLVALDPEHAVAFFEQNGFTALLVLGAVFLVVTGGEALYADMGHFGTRPIRLGWFVVVLPALLLNYFGQGALLLADPSAADNPFYRLVPGWGIYPMVVLSTAATIIASQAVISGAFSLTRQAIQFGYSPRLEIEHTSSEEIGQIYMPGINWILMLATIGLVLGFESSSNLAAAYGVAVTTTMVITTVLFYVVARDRWHWRRRWLVPLTALFLTVDLSFFGANVIKIPHGGWFPLVVAALIFLLMTTWRRGRQILSDRLREAATPVEVFLESMRTEAVTRVPGTAVFLAGNPFGTPPALLHNLKHNRVLHEQVLLLHVTTEEIPHVPWSERLEVQDLGGGFYRLVARYGFMENPNVPAVLARAATHGLECDPMQTTYFLSAETLLATKRPGMALWREHLFAIMSRNAQRATTFFRLPPNRVVELGAQIEL